MIFSLPLSFIYSFFHHAVPTVFVDFIRIFWVLISISCLLPLRSRFLTAGMGTSFYLEFSFRCRFLSVVPRFAYSFTVLCSPAFVLFVRCVPWRCSSVVCSVTFSVFILFCCSGLDFDVRFRFTWSRSFISPVCWNRCDRYFCVVPGDFVACLLLISCSVHLLRSAFSWAILSFHVFYDLSRCVYSLR